MKFPFIEGECQLRSGVEVKDMSETLVTQTLVHEVAFQEREEILILGK